ncbi:putative urea active transporter 1 [Venturia nashicola]|uniref:Putative urea active transporter 1 n=1 Tax=Venturia nashicola TaxID=86259 RepID=A0A4Z1NT43_9PEZI|nr:putative urea active transporter 1 [Venturia nashicola]TLD19530.1 putative urea active transporter 1 [Venturia nashicola]
MATPNHSSILIIGGGTWGCSIAYRLAKRGFMDIKVLDANEFPSKESAGNDVNKIMEEPEAPPSDKDSDEDFAWATIEGLATEVWKTDPTYQPYYHPTGFIYAAVGKDAFKMVEQATKEHPANWNPLRNAEDFKATMPNGPLTGEMTGWKGFLRNERAGFVEAERAMEATRHEATQLGVKFVSGDSGKILSLVFNKDRANVIGAQASDGTNHTADQIILSAGAGSDGLLDFKKQLRPTAWTLAHIPLTEDEVARYRGIPVLYGSDRGFFIPSLSSNELKVCDEHPGYVHMVKDTEGIERSVPFSKQQIPLESERRIRDFLTETSPHLARRPFTCARVCWDADTPDRLFLIDRHPEFKSLILAVGGSGHGFMCSPAVGILVADLLQEKMETRIKGILGWRPHTAEGRNWWDTQGRFGVEGKVMDFGDVSGWTDIQANK